MADEVLAVVHAWIDALNNRHCDRVIELSDPDIEIVGPRGSAHGHGVLRQWLDNTRVTLQTLRTFADGKSVVVAQHGVWRSTESDEIIGEADVASRFSVEDGLVVSYARHDQLDDALDSAGLKNVDEVKS